MSPAELLMGRRLRTRLDLLQPSIQKRGESQQFKQKEAHDARARLRKFSVNDKVYVRNFSQGERWLQGEIEAATGPVSYRVRMVEGDTRRCHQDQLRHRFGSDLPQMSDNQEEDISFPIPITGGSTNTGGTEAPVEQATDPRQTHRDTSSEAARSTQATQVRMRVSRPPDRYDPGLF